MKHVHHTTTRREVVLDDVTIFDPDPASHFTNVRAFFRRLRKQKISPVKTKPGDTDTDFRETICSARFRPNVDIIDSLIKKSMQSSVRQSAPSSTVYHITANLWRACLNVLCAPFTRLLKQGAALYLTWELEAIVYQVPIISRPRHSPSSTGPVPSPNAATTGATGSVPPSS